MKLSKRLVSLILVLGMLLSILPTAAFSAEPNEDYSDTVGKSVVFSYTEDTAFYMAEKNSVRKDRPTTVAASDLIYLDATVASYTIRDRVVYYRLQAVSGDINDVLTSYPYVRADAVTLSDDLNPIQSVTAQDFTVTGRMPEGTTLTVSVIDTNAYAAAFAPYEQIISGYTISLNNAGEVFEPQSPVWVTIGNFASYSEDACMIQLDNDDTDDLAYTSVNNIAYDEANAALTFMVDSFCEYPILYVNPLLSDERIIEKINTGLGLNYATSPVPIYKVRDRNSSVATLGADLRIGGTIFNDYFYYTAVSQDENVPFNNSAEYAQYLVDTYTDAYNEAYEAEEDANAAALQAVKAVWDYYLLDLYDPEYAWMSDNDYYMHYTPNSMGDNGFEWPKSANNYSSFHYADDAADKILPLSYDYLENGVDYDNFICNPTKTVTAAAAGDANSERQYNVQVTADAQAKVKAPVVMLLQIQTSWQLFDLAHANKLRGNAEGYIDDNTEVGAVADNTDLATLYEIKHALLDFVDYMEVNYPGNNLFLGITETKHDASTSMFNLGSMVTNNGDHLRDGIISWDIFGNCEHVHYDSNTLQAAVNNLPDNLSGLTDMDGNPISYDDVSKAVVVIGGPTENARSTNGYGCILPWNTFKSNAIDAVYGIRVNKGTSYSPAGEISWLDYANNNYGEPYSLNTTGNERDRGNFTHKYVSTTREEIVQSLINIAEAQMNAKGISQNNPDAFVDDVTVSDTIAPEFEIDTSKPITASVYDSDGNLVGTPIVFDEDQAGADAWIVEVNSDGSTTVSYTFDQINNTYKAVLDIPIVAKEDFIGSNNVLTNVGTPTASYVHTPAEQMDSYVFAVEGSNTPEVNVPIRFNANDGGSIAVWEGNPVDLKALDSDQMIADVMDRIDNYAQINGTVTFAWELPDGTTVPMDGEIVVTNGQYDPNAVPDLSCEYLTTAAGNYTGKLLITFTPNAVVDNGHFGDDANTAVGVEPRTESGDVNITALTDGITVSYNVRTDWYDIYDHSDDVVEYQLLANGAPYFDENGDPVIGYLSEDNGWQEKLEGLPAAYEIDGIPQMVEYSVVETSVKDGYNAEYATDVQIDEIWNGYLHLTLDPGRQDPKDAKFVHIEFTYGGVDYNYDYPLYIKDKDPNTQKIVKNAETSITFNLPMNTPVFYSGPDDNVGTPGSLQLPVNNDGTALSDVTITECFLYKNKKYERKKVNGAIQMVVNYDGQFPRDNQTFTTCEAEVVSECESRTVVPVFVIINSEETWIYIS